MSVSPHLHRSGLLLCAKSGVLCELPDAGCALIGQKRWRRRVGRMPHLPEMRLRWLMADEEIRPTHLTPENEKFVRSKISHLAPGVTSPIFGSEQNFPREKWTWESKRTGLLARKIGVMPQWDKEGNRMLCTLLEVLDNQVVKYDNAENWYRYSVMGKRKAFNDRGTFGRLVVGAVDADVTVLTDEYRKKFDAAGVPPKEHIAAFMITENARMQPGTRLYANHFTVGQFVDISGLTIDWGFEGAMHRWGFRGFRKDRNQTKTWRRTGTIGTSGDSMVLPGKKMPGHMGYEWRHTRGVRLLRIDVENQVLWARGPGIPGECGDIVQVKDCMMERKRIKDPPFPTFYPEEMEGELDKEQFVEDLFQMNSPTIEFEDDDDEFYARIRRAQVKKQAKAKRK